MTAPEVLPLPVHSQHGNSRIETVERTDQHFDAGPCGFRWCEVETLQDAVCGNGLALMDSRDDDAPEYNNAGGRMLHATGGSSFIDDKLKTFSKELEADVSGLREDNNPAMVSKQEGIKYSKTRYEHFLSLVDTTSKAYGAQSAPMADLYVNMANECNKNTTDVKSKELALLLFEEAFSIYQTKSGDSDEQTVDCRIHLGKTYYSLGRYSEALDCLCMAVYMREALLGELHPSVSEIWVLISSVHHAKSKLELALKASAKALTGYRKEYGDKHRTVIAVLRTIAQLHIEMGNNDKAADIQKYVRLHDKKGEI